MNRLWIIFLSVLLGFFLISSGIVAQEAERSQDQTGLIKPSIKIGVDTDDGFEFVWWSVGGDLDIHLNNTIMITPEIFVQGYKFDFDWVFLYPGATLNAKLGKPGGQFFIGAGSLLAIPIEPGYADTLLMFKMNAGALFDRFKLSFYLVTPFKYFFEKPVGLGASLGFIL